jgi:hypothetical protein
VAEVLLGQLLKVTAIADMFCYFSAGSAERSKS